MKIIFFLFKVFASLISRLPFRHLYLFSDMVRIVLQHVIRYRRKIIINNLKRSFPEKTPAEIRTIISNYYRNLADIIVEVIKLQKISPEELKERFSVTGFEHLNHAFENKRSVILAIGHCGNWEWMGAIFGILSPVKGFGVVKPLADINFHKYMESLRHRFNPDGTIPFQHTYRAFIRNKRKMVTINAIAADQTPTRSEINYWTKFLNQDTPFYIGVEKLARSLDFSVVYIDIRRTDRGRYTGDIQLITHTPQQTAELEITEIYIRKLEDSIRRNPDNWLWSHRRWKFSKSSPHE